MKALLLSTLLLPFAACLAADKPATHGETQRVAFAQYCFWTGEMKLGQIDGVLRTEAGFLEGHEVTVVDFQPAKISLPDLVHRAKAAGVADSNHFPPHSSPAAASSLRLREGAALDKSYRRAPASDQKKQIEGTPLARLPLTPEQATKVNAFARTTPSKALGWLTPAQLAEYKEGK